ncbi:MAG: TonB-dependent receptor [Steroidobacteraceae bacterium]|jgi:iron complex outermembrane receptor protein|nr:TonB-dependent receptor [Steroidobacteraceae bacterium]
MVISGFDRNPLRAAVIVALAAAQGLVLPTPAASQEAGERDAPVVGLGEIVVTAQRRESSVQDVGAAVSVLSSDFIEKASVRDTGDLAVVVPGLVVSRDIGLTTQIFVRGVGNNLLGIASGNSVATYVDGVYIPNSVQVFQNFNDVDRVEVLKGPQAVLYGRNSTGGALLISSKRPDFTPSLAADISYGNYDAMQVRATATGGLLDDRVAGRLSAQYSDRDGYSKSLSSGRDQDFEELLAFRAELLFNVSDSLEILLAGDYVDLDSGEFKKGVNPDGWMYQLSSPDQYSPDPRGRYQQFDGSQPSTDGGVRITVDWQTSFGQVQSVTSYRDFEVGPVFFDNDSIGIPMTIAGLPFQIAFLGNEIKSEQFYHETYLATATDKRLRAIVGFNYFDEDSSDFSNRYVGFAIARNDRQLDGKAYSAYVDVNYDVTPSLTAIAGARYSYEEKRYSQTGLSTTTNEPISYAENKGDWSEVTPRFGIEYRPANQTLLYATATNGFKSGGMNEANPLNIFDPETIWSYEAGVKHDWSGALRTNVSAFYYDYKDLQVQQIIIPSFTRLIRNAASAELYGFDLEVAARPVEALTLGANISYLHSEYGDFVVCIDLLGPCTITGPDGPILNPASNVNVKGNQLANAPELTAGFFAETGFRLASVPGQFRLNLNASYRSDMYFTPYEAAIHESESYWLLGAEARYESEDGRWFVSAFGRNLTDELYETWIANVARFLGPADGAPRYVGWGAPRTYGLRLGMRF